MNVNQDDFVIAFVLDNVDFWVTEEKSNVHCYFDRNGVVFHAEATRDCFAELIHGAIITAGFSQSDAQEFFQRLEREWGDHLRKSFH